ARSGALPGARSTAFFDRAARARHRGESAAGERRWRNSANIRRTYGTHRRRSQESERLVTSNLQLPTPKELDVATSGILELGSWKLGVDGRRDGRGARNGRNQRAGRHDRGG